MRYTLWIAVLVLGVMIRGCGSEKPESRPDKKAFWVGFWTVNPKSMENARVSTTGMAFFEDGSYQNGSFNKGQFYPFSKNGKWGVDGDNLFIIDGGYTNKAAFSILTNQEVRLDFKSSKLFMSKLPDLSK